MGDRQRRLGAGPGLGLGLVLAGLSACSAKPSSEAAGEPVSIDDEVFLTLTFGAVDKPEPPTSGPGRVSADVHADAIYLQHGRELLIIARDGGAHRSIRLDESRELLAVPDREDVLVWLDRAESEGALSQVFVARTAEPEQPSLLFDYDPSEAVYDPCVIGDRVALLTERGIVHAPLEGGAPQVLSLEHPVKITWGPQLMDQGGRLVWLGWEDDDSFVLSSDAEFESVTVEYETHDPDIQVRDAARVGASLVLTLHDGRDINESLVVMRRDAEGHMLELWRERFPESDLRLLSDGERGWLFSNGKLWQIGPDSHHRVRSFVKGVSGEPLGLAIDDGLLIWTSAHESPGELRYHANAALGLGEPLTRPLVPPLGWAINDDDDVWGNLTGTEVARAYGIGGPGFADSYDKPPPRVRQGAATVDGALDPDIIRRIIRAHINEVRGCYNAGLREDPELRGEVEVAFVIDATGKVQKTKDVSAKKLSDPQVHRCVGRAIRRWKFPKPPDGERVKVTVPFNLSVG